MKVVKTIEEKINSAGSKDHSNNIKLELEFKKKILEETADKI